MTKTAITSLQIRQLELRVHLGWPDIERQHEQTVLLDADIFFPAPPKACTTDHLDDTLCYSALINALREYLQTRKFHLIEHLTHEIYQLIRSHLPVKSHLTVRVTKHPEIQGLTGGIQFSYSDD
ncbi:dihydroneopterin aldolase [Aquicella lusitana]|uniref:dihydroneopterin aldolase n=1 Tax=Aquicella lusitana TaxID=254246 RepID=A0A370GC06_9COXI|nr:dihydroneopterin aldolase [Aquicella lusitana]RDI41345.1 dihydroneopterin aldolase [Aquicella lusitana]VVC74264.1 D-erythro-7,8-dihydroneopterin triphosphate epimerase [Aquicella lusitana]